MEKKRLLLVTQELDPYTGISEVSEAVAKLPKAIAAGGYEVRIIMPRYGTINERRHRLHEVVRLSGSIIIVDDDDYQLRIKVASWPGSRLQVYFMENNDFFSRKSIFEDDEGLPFEDNVDRAVFFCKGVVDTVKKFGWAPDIVLCHGWMTSLLPFYVRTAYKTEPLFEQSKMVYAMHDSPYDSYNPTRFFEKAAINKLEKSSLDVFRVGEDGLSMNKGAAAYADGLIIGSPEMETGLDYLHDLQETPLLPFQPLDEMAASYLKFFDSLITEEVS